MNEKHTGKSDNPTFLRWARSDSDREEEKECSK